MTATRRPILSTVLRWSGLSLAGVLIGLLIAAGRGGARSTSPPSSAPATPASASRPADCPCRTEAMRREASRVAEDLRGRLGASAAVIVDPPFVVAGNLPEAQLQRYLATAVRRPAEAMWASLFQRRPTRVITVLLFADRDSYLAGAKRLFGDENVSAFGYYRRNERALVMNIDTGTGTLVHELTHALMAFDYPGAPDWLAEGLACLHEQCRVADEGIRGLPNWRLEGLQAAIGGGTLRPLADLLADDDFYGPLRGTNYAQSRYFCLYLQHRDLLVRFYRACRDSPAAPPAALVEQLTGEPLERTDQAFRAWVMTLAWPAEPAREP
ncbi:MAG: hypothetical protein GX591_03120 [Planctomycetes bacterium]|nr:hypothetical protein [Planctomycetota bacterium]